MVVGAITNLSAMISNDFSSLIQQIGPSDDPLFYDVMVYIFGTILFAVFLLGVISFWLRRKGLGGASAKEKWLKNWKSILNENRLV